MAERAATDFAVAARHRLESAQAFYRAASGATYDGAFAQLGQMASAIWDAVVDLISAVMRQDGMRNLGRSTTRMNYLNDRLTARWANRYEQGYRDGLLMLHSFQHNMDLPERRFGDACRRCAQLVGLLNELLPVNRRLPADAYDWLLAVAF